MARKSQPRNWEFTTLALVTKVEWTVPLNDGALGPFCCLPLFPPPIFPLECHYGNCSVEVDNSKQERVGGSSCTSAEDCAYSAAAQFLFTDALASRFCFVPAFHSFWCEGEGEHYAVEALLTILPLFENQS